MPDNVRARCAADAAELLRLAPATFVTPPGLALLEALDLLPVEALDPLPLGEALDLVCRGELTDAKSALALIHAAHHLGRLT